MGDRLLSAIRHVRETSDGSLDGSIMAVSALAACLKETNPEQFEDAEPGLKSIGLSVLSAPGTLSWAAVKALVERLLGSNDLNWVERSVTFSRLVVCPDADSSQCDTSPSNQND